MLWLTGVKVKLGLVSSSCKPNRWEENKSFYIEIVVAMVRITGHGKYNK